MSNRKIFSGYKADEPHLPSVVEKPGVKNEFKKLVDLIMYEYNFTPDSLAL